MKLKRSFYLLSLLLLISSCSTDEISGNTQSTNISSITPQGFSIEAKDYSVNLFKLCRQ